jgi:hypothetical protein
VTYQKNNGWSFEELKKIPVPNRETKNIIDGFYLLNAVIRNADTKRDNLKFICLPGHLSADKKTCSRAMAYMHDLGAIMGGPSGRKKMDLKAWSESQQVWTDESLQLAESCHIGRIASYWQATFPFRKRISEGGRNWLYLWLGQLSREQIEDLYRGARIPERDVRHWADQFELRIRYLNASNLKCSQ